MQRPAQLCHAIFSSLTSSRHLLYLFRSLLCEKNLQYIWLRLPPFEFDQKNRIDVYYGSSVQPHPDVDLKPIVVETHSGEIQSADFAHASDVRPQKVL